MRAALFLVAPVLLLLSGRLAAASEVGQGGAGQCDASSDPGSCHKAEADGVQTLDEPPPAPSFEELGSETENATVNGTSTNGRRGGKTQALVILACLLGPMVFWMGCTIKFASDGSLPARLALWGLLPEAYAAVSVRAVAALLRLKSHSSTPVVVLQNCVTDAGALELVQAVRDYGEKAELQVLELQHNPAMSEVGLRAIAEAASEPNSKLEGFDFAANPQLQDCLVPVLAPLLRPKASKVNELKLADCGLTPQHMEALAVDIDRTKLKILDLSGNCLRGGGEALALVCEAPLLEELTLACCSLTLEDVQALADQLPFTSIRTLQLGGNGFGSDGVRALAAALPTSQVDELGLEGNGIEADALDGLGQAWAKRPFARIRLSGNNMSRETVQDFVKTLRTIHN